MNIKQKMSCRNPLRLCAANPHRQFARQKLIISPTIAIRAARFIHDDAPKRTNNYINPPASTRPPPLTLPKHGEHDSQLRYYFELGKGYVRFYKDGLKAVFANRRLLREKLARTPPDDRPSIFRPHFVPRTFSRADWVLLWRVRHDMLRLPLFGLMLVVLGEFTALVVLYVDGVVPLTCRIPKQVFKSQEKAEQRRKTAFEELEHSYPYGVLDPKMTPTIARSHVLRTLHLAGSIWDRIGIIPPGMWYAKGRFRLAYLEGDDINIVQDGGPSDLEFEEVRIACSERGIDILGKSENELRALLGDWLRLTQTIDAPERRRRMAVLLLTK